MGSIYMITCSVSGKSYIGISINNPETGRINDHLSGRGSRLISLAIEKYGRDSFSYELLESNVFPELLNDLEVAYIKKFNTVSPNGYNLDSGGNNNKIFSAETRQKMRDAKLGKTLSLEHREKLSDSHRNSEKVKNHLQKIRQRPVSEKTRRKMSLAMTGKKHTLADRQRMSEIAKEREAKKRAEGYTVSEETCKKISASLTGGFRNPQRDEVKSFYFSLSGDISTSDKRQLLRENFPNISKSTINYWVRKWQSEND